MSDESTRGTVVMEPQGAGRAPSPPATASAVGPPPRRGVPVWLVVVLILLAVLIAGGAAWLLRGSSSAPASGTAVTTSTEPATGTANTTPNVAVATAAPKPVVKPSVKVPTSVREAAIVKKVTGNTSTGYHLTVDYVQWLTGKAAAAAAKAHGDESPPPNDYYIVNDSPKLRTFVLPPSATISVLGWKGDGTDTLKPRLITPAQFQSVLTGGSHPRTEYTDGTFWLTVVDGAKVTRIVQQFRP